MIGKNSSKRVEPSSKFTKFVGHLGLIVGVFKELELDKLIDEKLPKERDHTVPHSVCILAMVLNDLGFVGQRLYLFPDFFQEYFYGKASWERCKKGRPQSILYWRNS